MDDKKVMVIENNKVFDITKRIFFLTKSSLILEIWKQIQECIGPVLQGKSQRRRRVLKDLKNKLQVHKYLSFQLEIWL